MCGINGILRLRDDAPPIDRDELIRTRDRMATRGPDGAGEWHSADGRIALGHRRLAIIDLTDAGAQPMSWDSGRYWIVYNGEIYNYRELRAELERESVTFTSHSDTEVLLALYARDGERMFPRLRGMYAFAIWDEVEKSLVLARDPYGIKPLYYSLGDGTLRFASQVKALEAGGAVSMSVDPGGLVGFLLWGSVPEPFTIREAIKAVPAGHFAVARDGRLEEPRPHYRWDEPLPAIGDGSVAGIAAAVEKSIKAHLVSDVPVAVFLSAGLDSSMIAAVASQNLPEPPVTFTIRFPEFVNTPNDEGPLAAETAGILGTRHIERMVQREEMDSLWPSVLDAMDQPSIDGFNTFIVSKLAAEHGIRVALSGLGGDELFGGYASFQQVPNWARAARLLRLVPGLAAVWPRVTRVLAPRTPKSPGFIGLAQTLPGAYFLRRGLFLPAEISSILDRDLADQGLLLYDPVRDAGRHLPPRQREGPGRRASDWRAVAVMESTQYMRNQLLRDADWATMASSLEQRVPFCDTLLLAATRASQGDQSPQPGKVQIAGRLLGSTHGALMARRKTGFSVPSRAMASGDPKGRANAQASFGSRAIARELLQAWGGGA